MSKENSFMQSIRFVLSGGLATTSHWLVMALMINTGIFPTIATATGAFIGAIINYILQRNMTFKFKATHRSTLPRYIIVCVLLWVANLLIFFVLHRITLISTMNAQGFTTLVVALMSYFLYKRIVFNDQQSQSVY